MAFLPSAITGLLEGLSQLMHPQGLAYPKCSINAVYDYFQAQLMDPSHYPSVPSVGAVSDQLLEEFGSNTRWRLGERMTKGIPSHTQEAVSAPFPAITPLSLCS